MLAYCTALGLPEGHLVYAKGSAPRTSHQVRHAGVTIHQHAPDLEQPPTGLLAEIALIADRLWPAPGGSGPVLPTADKQGGSRNPSVQALGSHTWDRSSSVIPECPSDPRDPAAVSANPTTATKGVHYGGEKQLQLHRHHDEDGRAHDSPEPR